MSQPERILGIDPGTVVMGFGVVERVGSELRLIDLGSVKFAASKESVERLGDILASVEELLDRFQPTSLAVEAPFFGKNVQSMLKLGRAQGVVLSAGLRRGLTVAEYPPAVVKRRISGRGAASKEQLAGFLEAMYTIPVDPKRALDATDALAVATCHALTVQRTATLSAAGALPSKKKYSARASSWAKFLAQNPDREA
ncbi:MAG: crossover junction endodeoxyribonuclease RuvC [Bacteroidota bacterium]|jgi:crossover junction endodeoxyribonuclease RuvC